jgi:threonine dehydratase
VTVVQAKDIAAARVAIEPYIHTTPLFESATLSARTGAHVFHKAELFQKTGSFKVRGAFAKLERLMQEHDPRGVVAVSSGNHAQAVAYCARRLGIPCVAVMWKTASPQKIAAARNYGATVDLEAADATEAIARAQHLAASLGFTPVHAYDDPDVIAGQGTLADELLDQQPDLDTILVPVSGGGLLAGVAVSIKARNPEARVVAVEPQNSPALTEALAAGRPVEVPSASLADGLGAPAIGSLCFELIAPLVDAVITVSDEQIIEAMRWLFQYSKLAVEPAGAVTTAALLTDQLRTRSNESVVAIVSGGNVDLQQAAGYLHPGPPKRST